MAGNGGAFRPTEFVHQRDDPTSRCHGSYEPKSIIGAAKKYGIALGPIEQRLVNAAAFIFGKIYFPTRSNSLKDVGKYVGAAWSIPDASYRMLPAS